METGSKAVVTLGHGSGGRLTQALVRDVFLPRLGNPRLALLGDSAILGNPGGPIAFTTDGFVVSPRFFPGGDIGTLAVCGTVNDLAVAWSRPIALSASFIIEEGLPIEELVRIVDSMARAAVDAGVEVVTGDTKVVERGHGDGIYIVTAGVGAVWPDAPGGPDRMVEGDEIVVSGPIGDHGAVIAALRHGMEPGPGLASDCAPITVLVDALRESGVRPRFLRDPTRGGLATVLAEMARDVDMSAEIREDCIPIRREVRGLCEILGLESLFLACEGRMVAVVPRGSGLRAVDALRTVLSGQEAAVIGRLVPREAAPVILETAFGGRRLCDTPASEPLPRIC